MLEIESLNCKDTVQGSKTSFLTTLLKTENLDNNLIKIIYEFILNHGFESTAKSLINEAKSLGFKFLDDCFIKNEIISEEICVNILEQFNGGNWKKFFKLWDDFVPENIKSTMEYKILTLKLRVHFAFLPVRSKISSKKSDDLNNSEDSFDSDPDVETAHDSQREASMNQLKKYLLTIDAVDYNSCIELFGLPYLEDPMTDPTVSDIFTQNWVDELTINLKIFLVKHGEIVQPDENYKSSPKNSTTSTIITTESMNKEQLELYEKNLQILNSFDLDSVDERNKNIEEKMENDILRFSRTSTEDLGNNKKRIIVNDQNIPFFIEELDLNREFFYSQKMEVKIQSTQTRIQGIKSPSTLLAIDELSYPIKVLDPENLLKSPKSSMKKYEEQLIYTMTRYQNVHGNYQKLKIRFHKLHSDHQKLLHVTDQLTQALENSLSGNPVDMLQVLETCFTIFPDVFQKNLKADSNDEVFKSEDELQTNQIKINHCFDVTVLSPKSIDFRKIKFHLSCGNLKTKLLLLQALRWKITFSQQGERDEVLHEYINNDLLAIRGNIAGNSVKAILPNILYSVEGSINILQQSAARLLNTIASLRCGRDYLSIGTITLNAVIECLNGRNDSFPDAFTYDMLLAMLQKLSLRKSQRINMIETGLVEWLIHHLKIEVCKMSPYRFKYVTALLMNLSLQIKARAQVSASLVLPTLMDLLLTENQTALPYISKALSNFLLNQQINEEGKRMGLESYLKYYRKRVSDETRHYLDYLIRVHNREEKIEEIDVGDNDDDDCDFIEDELDEDDPIQNEIGDLAGEMLLASYYISAKSSELDKPNSDFKLHKIHQHREIIPRESSKMNITSSSSFPSASESLQEGRNDQSSIASVEVSAIKKEEEEEAFHAKPKIQRTPPQSAKLKSLRELNQS
ncbi:lisH domain-containing protein ARMC9-like isoform X2 [Leptopilina boulardi]|uniref:lisH domain-containing protein ARMC9-like isoform X2 n=1 Tax=Leptopilina boulardi TaxID=63433 RepID=UPI0021F5BFCD|nr:lisH domain-containing protein ARMC9-like isoform X2 [Leptopilina boulardi]